MLEIGERYHAQGVGQVEILDLEPASYSARGNPKLKVRVYGYDGSVEEKDIPAHDIREPWTQYEERARQWEADRTRMVEEEAARRAARAAELKDLVPRLWTVSETNSQSKTAYATVEARDEQEAKEVAADFLEEKLYSYFLEWDEPETRVEPNDDPDPDEIDVTYRDYEDDEE